MKTVTDLFVELFGDAVSPLDVNIMYLARPVNVSQLNAHLHGQQAIRLVGPVNARRVGVVHFGIELGQDLEVALQVGGQDGFNDQVAEAFEFGAVQVHQKVAARVGEEQRPGGSSVMVLKYRPIVIEDRLFSRFDNRQ